jgi:hypothetical protein
MGKSFSNRKFEALVILALLTVAAVGGAGQEERPQIIPQKNRPQENKKPKKGKEPRAVGVVQLSGSKGTLIPVAILIDGRFYDAGAYKADPVPMAIDVGTVYEVEQAGDSQGLFTVNGALHSQTVANGPPWKGTGTFLPQGADAPKDRRKAEDVPVGLDKSGGDEPPRLTRKDSSKASSSSGAPSDVGGTEKSGTAQGGGTASGGSSGQSTSGPDKGGDAKEQTPAGSASPSANGSPEASSKNQSSPAPNSSAQPSSDESSGKQSAPGRSKSGQPTSGQSTSGDENYYRPTLRRGKPTQTAPADEEKATKQGAAKADSSGPATAPSAANMKMIAAISDSAGPEPQSYKFFWKAGEEEERRGQMVALAENEVRAYAAALVKNRISAQPGGSKATLSKGKTTSKQAQPVLENVQFHGFDVWLNNQLVMVLSADAHIPGTPDVSSLPDEFSAAVVARTDIYGNLQKLFSAVTDKFHFDVTPRLELIDVVDADGDGRGELLFRETSDVGNGYLIYRATADRLWKMFDSLNAE